MDEFDFQNTLIWDKKSPTRVLFKVLAVVFALVGIHFFRLPDRYGEGSGADALPFLISVVLGVVALVLAVVLLIKSFPSCEAQTHTSLRFIGESVQITYHALDRDDGRGPHSEVLTLGPQDIRRIQTKTKNKGLYHFKFDFIPCIIIEHAELGQKSTEKETWGIQEGSTRAALLERFSQYSWEYRGGLQTEELLRLAESIRNPQARGMHLEATGNNSARAGASPAANQFDPAASPGAAAPQPGQVAAPQDWQETRARYQEKFAQEQEQWAKRSDRSDLRLLEVNEQKKKKMLAPYRTGTIVTGIIAAVSLLAALPALLFDSSSFYSDLGCTGLVFDVPILIVFGLLWIFKSPGKLQLFIGTGRMVYDKGSHYYIYNDSTTIPPCIRSIEHHEVKKHCIVVYGDFMEENDDSDGGGRRTTKTRKFKIPRVFDGEEQLLALLSQLEKGW